MVDFLGNGLDLWEVYLQLVRFVYQMENKIMEVKNKCSHQFKPTGKNSY